MSSKKHNYDESKIKTLSSLEHIRTRTGMYIGRLGDGSHYDDGIYILIKEVIDNAIDEFIMGYGKQVEISLDTSVVRVRDFGRGIPLGKVIECVSRINTGAKYNDETVNSSKPTSAGANYDHKNEANRMRPTVLRSFSHRTQRSSKASDSGKNICCDGSVSTLI
jgi:DNA gyrase/topoisomerase IV subunit B